MNDNGEPRAFCYAEGKTAFGVAEVSHVSP